MCLHQKTGQSSSELGNCSTILADFRFTLFPSRNQRFAFACPFFVDGRILRSILFPVGKDMDEWIRSGRGGWGEQCDSGGRVKSWDFLMSDSKDEEWPSQQYSRTIVIWNTTPAAPHYHRIILLPDPEHYFLDFALNSIICRQHGFERTYSREGILHFVELELKLCGRGRSRRRGWFGGSKGRADRYGGRRCQLFCFGVSREVMDSLWSRPTERLVYWLSAADMKATIGGYNHN